MHAPTPVPDIAWARPCPVDDEATTLVRHHRRAAQPSLEWPGLTPPRSAFTPHVAFGAGWLSALVLVWMVLGGTP